MKKRGRPRIDDDKKVKYQLIAVHFNVYQLLKFRAQANNMTIVKYIESLLR